MFLIYTVRSGFFILKLCLHFLEACQVGLTLFVLVHDFCLVRPFCHCNTSGRMSGKCKLASESGFHKTKTTNNSSKNPKTKPTKTKGKNKPGAPSKAREKSQSDEAAVGPQSGAEPQHHKQCCSIQSKADWHAGMLAIKQMFGISYTY